MKKNVLLMSLMALFLVGCSTSEAYDLDLIDEAVTLSESESNSLTAKGIGNAPEQSGSYLFRFETAIGLLLVDYETEMSMTYAVDIEAFCNDEAWWGYDMIQVIDIPNNELREIVIQQGEEYTKVFDGTPTDDDLCYFFANTPILAEGIVKMIYNNNDTNSDGSTSDANNTNSQSLKFHGRLMKDGKMKNLSARFQVVWDKGDRFRVVETVRLR